MTGPVGGPMGTNVLTAHDHAGDREPAGFTRARHVVAVPLVDPRGRLVGLVGRSPLPYTVGDGDLGRAHQEGVVRGQPGPSDVEVVLERGAGSLSDEVAHRSGTPRPVQAVRAAEGVAHVRRRLSHGLDDPTIRGMFT